MFFVLLFALNFVAHTFQYQNMGLYEDDYGHIASAFKFDESTMLDYAKGAFLQHWPLRPTGWVYVTPFCGIYCIWRIHLALSLSFWGINIVG